MIRILLCTLSLALMPNTYSASENVTPAAAQSAVSEADALLADYHAWQKKRATNLQAEKSWLSLVGLHWLEQGEFRLGSGKKAQIRLAAGPKDWGTLSSDGKQVSLVPKIALLLDGKPAVIGQRYPLRSDQAGPAGAATEVAVGTVSFVVIDRSSRLALRVRNSTAKTRTQFQGLDYFPYQSSLRISAKYQAYETPRSLDVATIVGTVEPTPNPGKAIFEIDGQAFTLELLEGDAPGQFFTIFGDRTNGRETYGMARFLTGTMDAATGTAVVDFNRAYNPPCAFTEFATCPMPPEGNRINLAIRAGEKRYSH